MTQSPTQPQPLALDALTHAAMLCTTMDALPFHPQATADQKAVHARGRPLAIATLRPRDPLEAMLAARIVAFHSHVMDNFRKPPRSRTCRPTCNFASRAGPSRWPG